MNDIKRKYGTKKVGFSGTLDPFATGSLIVATGQYTKLLQYLDKAPKVYQATLWLGVRSPSLDIENIDGIKEVKPFKISYIKEVLASLKGELTYYPPQFSAKKIDGKRAYTLARAGKKVTLKTITSTIYDIQLLRYNHPFIHFKAKVSEGTYIRSLAALLSDKLGVEGTLSSLQRIQEGAFYFDHEKALDPFVHLTLPYNIYTGDETYMALGKKLQLKYFKIQKDGIYLVESSTSFSIIEIDQKIVKYRLNKIPKFQNL